MPASHVHDRSITALVNESHRTSRNAGPDGIGSVI